MSERLFRGKRKDNGEWVEGFYGINTICCEQSTYLSAVISKIPQGIYDCESWEVDPETVGQCIGQADKNGTKIFEWDIVKCTDDTGIENIFVIMWDSRRAMFYLNSPTFKTDFYYYCADELEVIGNIFTMTVACVQGGESQLKNQRAGET